MNTQAYETPAANETHVYALTVTSGAQEIALELSFDARGTWTLKGEKDLKAALVAKLGAEAGEDRFSDWLIDFWHNTPLGRHVWRLGNPPITRPPA